jgi:hypothetical protein
MLDEEAKPYFSEIGHLPEIEFPKDNTYSPEKAMLGKTLFMIRGFQVLIKLPVLLAMILNWDGVIIEWFLLDTTDNWN